MSSAIYSTKDALKRLVEGNSRFYSHVQGDGIVSFLSGKVQLVQEQKPFAVILGCSDSRVPAEIVFDQGVGDLFVIRIAGNIVASSQIESVEFAVSQFQISLVVVLGHSQCGAVKATFHSLKTTRNHTENKPEYLNSIIGRIRPAISNLPELKTSSFLDEKTSSICVRANVRFSVQQLVEQSVFLNDLSLTKKLSVIGGEYCLKTGTVDFFDATGNPINLDTIDSFL